ncbi:MAG: histidinol dehydrogenase [Bacillota bacterium]|jgi:histidinol dehydrogenase
MIKIWDLRQNPLQFKITDICSRKTPDYTQVETIVEEIIAAVKKDGDQALFAYIKKFDQVDLTALEVPFQEIEAAYINCDPYFRETLEIAAANIKKFHKKQLHSDFLLDDQKGITLGQKYTPLERVGIYVPGGTASYPSSVLMNALPARIAGVKEIIMVTPPSPNGEIPSSILTAAKIAGIGRIFKMGGAHAIAALAYGTESIPKVDKIVGPGNIYVTTAKRKVFGSVAIDMIAGPSEILILADASCNPAYVAADMLSQAEHDTLAAAILITTSQELAQTVSQELEKQLQQSTRQKIADQAITNNSSIVITNNLDEAIKISNLIAPEHLEICLDDPFSVLEQIYHAGSIFLGKNTPEALGDYFAGPNHTLPTNGTARFSSPLSVDDFVKKSSFIYYSKAALSKVKDRLIDFAHQEGLPAHARSISIRFEEDEK